MYKQTLYNDFLSYLTWICKMTHANKNTVASDHEPIQVKNIIVILGTIFFAALATVISIYFNEYKLNISCEKKRPDETAICQVVKISLLGQNTVLFDNQPITTADILGVSIFNRSSSPVSNNFQIKLCKAQLYGIDGEAFWKTQHYNEWWGQNCFGYDDSGAFVSYLENQEVEENKKLSHNYQLAVYKHWDKHFLSFLGWVFVCTVILMIYCYIRLAIELRKMSRT